MKAYIKNVDWADEGDILFFSIESEENLQVMKELLKIYSELDLLPYEEEMYWGTNEFFTFTMEDLVEFIDQAEDISEEELKVFQKFSVRGFDIYEQIYNLFYNYIVPNYNYRTDSYILPDISKEDLTRIEPLFIKLYEQDTWDRIIKNFKQYDLKRNN